MSNHQGKVVAITGASSGIGLEAAKLYAAAGASVVLLARRAEALAVATRAVAALAGPGLVAGHALDVADEAAVQQVFPAIVAQFGRIDILVNCAGTGFATDLAKISLADYRRIMETNVTGVFLCSRAVLPAMRERKSGHIVNVSSITGKVANPNAPLYCASKFALNGYTSGLQQQVAADKVRVSLVSPSSVDTAYWDGRPVDRTKFLQAGEVAAVILFVTGQPEGVLIKDVDLTALR